MEKNRLDTAVSVVVPMLNTRKYVGECLESIRNQTLKEIEVLCVDGGSTDGTLEVVEEYIKKDRRFRLITDAKESYGAQVNRGMELAQGDYVAIAEPDDYVSEDMYRSLYQEAVQTGADIVRNNYCRFIGDGEERYFFPKSACKREWYGCGLNAKRDKELFECSPANWSGIYRSGFLRKRRIRHNTTKGAAYQDLGFWFLTFALADEVRFVNKMGYYYRLDNPESSINAGDKTECLTNEISWLEEQLTQRQIYQDFSEKFHRVKEIHTAWMQRKMRNIRETELYKRIKENIRCILFGGGADGVDFLLLLRREGILKHISCITDNDSGLWGKKLLGIPVVSPADTIQMKDTLYIITSSRYAMEIKAQLTVMGIRENNIQLWGTG
ncbi:MAG: glycosyltransferase [Lachnospiraceae bacterium]|nr:glycosyltransferase [Lachnospiraceae bacterium]